MWGMVSVFMVFIYIQIQFYVVCFLVGVVEVSFYFVCYFFIILCWFNYKERLKVLLIMLIFMLVFSIVGLFLVGVMLDIIVFGLKGWQMLFFIEGIIVFIFGIILIFWFKDLFKDVNWLIFEEKKVIIEEYEQEIVVKNLVKNYILWQVL